MTRTKRNVLIALGALILAALIAAVSGWYIQQRAFFRETEIVAGGERDSAVQYLSEQLGIELDPAIEQHVWLIENRDRLVIYQNYIDSSTSNEMQVIPPTARDVANLVSVYTGYCEMKGHMINIVLIGSGSQEYEGLTADGMDMILQVRAGPFYSPLRYVDASIENDAFWSALEEDSACLLYSSAGNCWAVGRGDLTSTLGKRQCPQSFAGSGVSSEKVDLIQLCGRIILGLQDMRDEYWLQIDFRAGQRYDPEAEYWGVEVIDSDVRTLMGR